MLFRKPLQRLFASLSLWILFCGLSLGTECAAAAVPLSAIHVTVSAASADLAALINQSLPKELYKGQGALGTSVTVLRTGPVAVAAADNFVFLTLPVQLTGRYAAYESYPLRIDLRFKARADVTPDWRLKTELYYTGLSDQLVDTFKIGPLSLNPKSLVEGVVLPVQKLFAPLIDAKVNESLPLKGKIAPLWEHAFQPMPVSREFSAWLRLTPERIVMSPLTMANNQIRLSVGVVTGAEITVGPKPAATPAKALPAVQSLASFDRSFQVRLPVEIVYADLVTALKPVLLDKTFGGEKKVTVRSFNVKGEAGRLVLVLTATGDFDGELTLLAKPVYHPRDNALTFEDVDFDTKNAGWLISVGSWLLSSPIRETIKTRLDAAVGEQLEAARRRASAALSAVPVADHVTLNGAVKALSLGEAQVADDRLAIQVVAQGEAAVVLK